MKRIKTFLLAGAIAAAMVLGGCSGSGSGHNAANDKVGLNDKEMAAVETKLDKIDELLDKYYLEHTEYSKEDMIENIYKVYVASLGDPYTVYYDEEEYARVNEETKGEYSGIGVMVTQDVYTMTLTVTRVFKGYGADNAGILADDIIVEVDGEDITQKDINYVVSIMKGEEGTSVPIKVYRPSTDEYITMPVERMLVHTPTVEYRMLDNGIGHVEIISIEGVTAQQFSDAVESLKSQGMKGLIIDLRNNPGGLVDQTVKMCDKIMPADKTVVSVKDKNKQEVSYKTLDDETFDLPIVLLVNQNSASSSEIMTTALSENGYATVVGTQTFGKGIIQVVLDLGDGSGIKITMAEYFSPNGNAIHEQGITPDIIVELDKETPEDEQLDAAINELMKQIQ